MFIVSKRSLIFVDTELCLKTKAYISCCYTERIHSMFFHPEVHLPYSTCMSCVRKLAEAEHHIGMWLLQVCRRYEFGMINNEFHNDDLAVYVTLWWWRIVVPILGGILPSPIPFPPNLACSFQMNDVQFLYMRNRCSSVGIAAGYGMDAQGVGFRIPVATRVFSSPRCPDRSWGQQSFLFKGYQGLFLPAGEGR
jgi:hypothetical protein